MTELPKRNMSFEATLDAPGIKGWDGRPIPDNETPDTEIVVWEVNPHPSDDDIVLLERSWQRMLDYVASNLDGMLERQDKEELTETPFNISFRLRRMQKRYYDEIVADCG